MNELRWNPILDEWVIVASHRASRPNLPEECPFCPGAQEIPEKFDVLALPNRYPSLSQDSHGARGFCEVVIYSPEHNASLRKMSAGHVVKLIDLWRSRYEALGKHDFVKYVFIFENRGEKIGVTLSHPHGQIYAFPFIPPIIERELLSARKYMNKNKKCLFCDILKKEKGIVFENAGFVSIVPSFARWSFEVHTYSKRHLGSLGDLKDGEKRNLAESLKEILRKYDKLFDSEMPYMMVLHQIPTDGKKYPHYHFHIEFYPLYRDRNKTQYRASVESGAGTFTNPSLPEESARRLREI
jgi:UDPglucose--hexose-1-phosphate uridylyltransferase